MMVAILLTKHYKVRKFAHEAQKLNVTDKCLSKALVLFLKTEVEDRQKYALGAGLYKLRLATHAGQGKSGGSRSVLAFKKDDRVV